MRCFTIFFAGSICAHLYEPCSARLLPVVTYPLRIQEISLALAGLVLRVLVLMAREFSDARDKTSAIEVGRWTFVLAFLIAGFVTKIVGEAVHELLGHGSFVLLFGGQVTHFHISFLWPYEFSYVRWSLADATPDQTAMIMGGGILVGAIISFSIQFFLLWKKLRWQFSVPLFWLSFWCYANATGYLILGGIFPFGDVKELFRLRVLTSSSAVMVGTVLFFGGFLLLSEILRRTLTTLLKEKTRWWILTFWFVVPALVGLTTISHEMFHLFFVPISFAPILLSFLLEFVFREKKNI